MIAAIASAAVLVAASLLLGRALLLACGRADPIWFGAPVGLAALIASSGIAAGAGIRGTGVAIAGAVLVLAAGVVVALSGGRWGRPKPARFAAAGLAAAGLAALFAAVPFIAAGQVGILGVGLVNDDMASHLLLADWIDERFRPEPVLIDQGYPIGPHALVAGLGDLLGAGSIEIFAGLTLAIPALTALVAFGALEGVRTGLRVPAAALVALPYMAAAYLAQEAFKEPILALLLLGFAVLLPQTRSWRHAIALGVIAAGALYVYSFPGLAWLLGVAVAWGVLELARGARPPLATWAPAAAAGLAVLAVIALPDLERLRDFADFRALDPDRANEGGLGNLRGHISPLEALGIWPTGEFRLSATAGDLPAWVFYGAGLASAAALAIGLVRWLRERGPAVPAALLTAALLYLAARGFGTVYTSAKALAIAAPLVMLLALGGLLAARTRALTVFAALFGLAAALSSLLILRQAPVAPETHGRELARIRSLVEGEKLLFLGRDNFILYELRGSKPFVAVRNFYDPYYVEPNTELENVFSKFDFDSVSAATLAEFTYVLTTRAAYASGPPPGYSALARTASYVLWEKGRSPLGRLPGERDAAPGRVGGCEPGSRPSRVASFAEPPVVSSSWSSAMIEDGAPATIELSLSPGRWALSLQYDASRPLTLTGAGLEARLPGNLDYRGAVPFWPVTEIEVRERGPLEVTASVERPPLAGRLLGANSVAHLGSLAATPASGSRVERDPRACRDYVDWYRR